MKTGGIRLFFLAVLAGGSGCGSPVSGPDGAVPGSREMQARLSQPFAVATRSAADPPVGVAKPIDVTFTGKRTHPLIEEVQASWDSIDLMDGAGQVLAPVVLLETSLGTVEITLNPGAAPNHVRNFLALIEAKYYDGMRFDRIRQEEVAGAPELNLVRVEAGCPLGDGTSEGGHLGYWLRSEASRQLPAMPLRAGVVGACLGADPDSGCCRFFVLLQDARYLEGEETGFGTITRGIAVIQAIFQHSLGDAAPGSAGNETHEPVLIHQARRQRP